MAESNNVRDRRLPEEYTTAELHAIATRALAEGDDYSRRLLREQLDAEGSSDPLRTGHAVATPRSKPRSVKLKSGTQSAAIAPRFVTRLYANHASSTVKI
jgi:hypothetical protein